MDSSDGEEGDDDQDVSRHPQWVTHYRNCMECQRYIVSSTQQWISRNNPWQRYCCDCKRAEMVRYDRRDMSADDIVAQKLRRNEYGKVRIATQREAGDVAHELQRCFYRVSNHHCHEDSFDLTLEYVHHLFDVQAGRCAITGIAFDTSRSYLCPSIDADVPWDGHTKSNCQLVLRIINYAKNGLSTVQYRRIIACAIAGDDAIEKLSFYRPNNAKSRPLTVLVDPALPLNMTIRSRLVWDALVQLSARGESPCRSDIGAWISQHSDETWASDKNAKENVQNAVNSLVRDGYVDKLAVGARRLYRPHLPPSHPSVHRAPAIRSYHWTC